MRKEFELEYRNEISHFLGMEVIFDPIRGYSLSQIVNIKSISEDTRHADCKPNKTPLVPNKKIRSTGDKDILVDQTKYREILGRSSYVATHTRPDIAYAVSKLVQYQVKPSQRHMDGIYHILAYLKGTPNLKLAPADSSNPEKQVEKNRLSVSGFITFIGNAVVEWGSKKQNATVSNTTEAELVAANKRHQHARYFVQLLRELKVPNWKDHVPIIYCENQAVVEISTSKKNLSTEIRHVDIKYQKLSQQAQIKKVYVDFIGTNDQLADGLTKPLDAAKVPNMRTGLILLE